MKLTRLADKKQICSHVRTAESFFDKLVGLIGTKQFSDQGLFFPNERWPHTFFMSIPIDVIYVDKKMKVVKIDHNLRPWRIPLPVFSAWGIFELPAGLAHEKQVQIGDVLHVGN